MKEKIIGIILLLGAFGAMFWQAQETSKAAEEAEKQRFLEEAQKPSGEAQELATTLANEMGVDAPAQGNAASDSGIFQTVETVEETIEPVIKGSEASIEEQLHTIENDYIRVTFTNLGGAIKQVEFIAKAADGDYAYAQTLEGDTPYAFNDEADMPALALSWNSTTSDGKLIEYKPGYKLVNRDDTKNTILYSLTTPNGITIYRGYQIQSGEDKEPYLIKHETKFVNNSENAVNPKVFINAGTLPPTEGDNYNIHLNVGYYDMLDEDEDFIESSKFMNSSGFLGFGSNVAQPFIRIDEGKYSWLAVKNQFFAGIITPRTHQGNAIYTKPYNLNREGQDERHQIAITGNLGFDLGTLASKGEDKLKLDYYVGPKEFSRLKALGDGQDSLMQFGWGPIGFIAEILLGTMTVIHDLVVHISPVWAWGFTIILLTTLIKGAMWPLTAAQIKSSKRMQLISEPMKELREKYADNPQRMQQEMMKLFKENKVNPAAGCLPLLVQIPIFLGLFFMLRTASELRFAEFLWITDLSVPDTVSWLPSLPEAIPLFGGPIHILPFLMLISMYFQMKMMPTPATDNIQIKMLKFMPFIFFFFSYSFPAGLVLYWTSQNVLTIIQTKMTKGMREAPVIVASDDKKKPAKKMKKAKKV